MMAPRRVRFFQGDRYHDMNIAVAYKLQQAQLQALFRQKQARTKVRKVKQKHSAAPSPASSPFGDRQGLPTARDSHRLQRPPRLDDPGISESLHPAIRLRERAVLCVMQYTVYTVSQSDTSAIGALHSHKMVMNNSHDTLRCQHERLGEGHHHGALHAEAVHHAISTVHYHTIGTLTEHHP